jgi:hypothetical protein
MGRPAPADLLERIAADAAPEGAAGPAQAVVDGVEVVQAVQDHLNSVPLVAGKRTVVRVYLSYPAGPASVRGVLRVARSASGPWLGIAPTGPAQLDPARSGASLAALASRREDLAFSLNFVLPASMAAAGQTWLSLASVRTQAGYLPLAPRQATSVSFLAAAPLRVHIARIRYSQGGSTATHLPSALDIDLIRSWLRRAYPVAQVVFTTTTIDAPHDAPFDAAEINAALIALRAADVAAGTDRRTHYYGLVDDEGGFMRGLASGIPSGPSPGTVASGPTGTSTFGWDADGSYGDWYTGHELGHTFGRRHAEFCGAGGGGPFPFANGQLSDADGRYVGLDVGDPLLAVPMRALPGTDWHDVMSYCDNQWLSSFTYDGIRQRLAAEDALGAGGPPGEASAGPGDAMGGIQVVAAANLTRSTGTLTAVMPTASPPSPPDDESGRPPIAIVLLDAAGESLAEHPARFQPSACEEPDDDVTGTIDAVLDAPPGARRVELRLGDAVLDAREIGGPAAPPGGPGAGAPAGLRRTDGGAGDEVVVEWDAPGPSPGRRYLVQASADGGATWRTVGLDLAEPLVRIEADDFPGEDALDVRVIATSGTEQALLAQDRIPLAGP